MQFAWSLQWPAGCVTPIELLVKFVQQRQNADGKQALSEEIIMPQSSTSAAPTLNITQVVPDECANNPEQALVILTSAALQTQGMAMALCSALQKQGVLLNIMLCDQAGDLAIQGYQSPQVLAPQGMTPEGLLQQLLNNGADVSVCALYLPNSSYQEEDLRQGVRVADPAGMAQLMRNANSKVFTF